MQAAKSTDMCLVSMALAVGVGVVSSAASDANVKCSGEVGRSGDNVFKLRKGNIVVAVQIRLLDYLSEGGCSVDATCLSDKAVSMCT